MINFSNMDEDQDTHLVTYTVDLWCERINIYTILTTLNQIISSRFCRFRASVT